MNVRFFAAAAAATGVEEQRIDLATLAGSQPFTLADLSEFLVATFPASASSHTPPLADVLTRCSFLLNEVSTRDLTLALSAGDVVDVLPPFAGG
ncbi:molybdopterin converting factor small subunit [Arthrobacter stackebrandtii]|uniref:Molybdopterin converting factor small subunit n=1 Tax=Arthrobacter stackebrandtii TaxID=272161 RepID=A0ABS4YR74_9MICC|nr:MoaD/ThiS family protein [Arthrobacter stackebrandtii]MBP2411286.1 molybdopterin converting factor small subunit [Arthrobacter stackebrandtii]PYH00116.1 molybdopterin synthase sulfur carrier subunit [Arthrobacter stackebrandtii]